MRDLHNAAQALRMTAPVDDDFPAMMHNFDAEVKAAGEYLESLDNTGEVELLPCPFCSGSDLYAERKDLSETVIACNTCGVFGPGGCPENDSDLEIEEAEDLHPGELMARREWNKRADVTIPASDFELVQETLRVLDAYWKPKDNGFYLMFHQDGSFGIGYYELSPKAEDPKKRAIKHEFYAGTCVEDLLAYCRIAKDKPSEAYIDR